MTTLTTAPVAPLLERLFGEADADVASLGSIFPELAPDELAALLTDRAKYRDLYSRVKALSLSVSRDTGKLLYMLARATGARSIVEFGTSFGVSTIHLAAALRDNGGGRLITTEFEPSKVARAGRNLAAAELLDLVELREGDALETLGRDLPDTIDLVLLDGAKSLYLDILTLLERRLRSGALIVADNAEMCPEYLAQVRAAFGGYVSTSISDEVELTVRAG